MSAKRKFPKYPKEALRAAEFASRNPRWFDAPGRYESQSEADFAERMNDIRDAAVEEYATENRLTHRIAAQVLADQVAAVKAKIEAYTARQWGVER